MDASFKCMPCHICEMVSRGPFIILRVFFFFFALAFLWVGKKICHKKQCFYIYFFIFPFFLEQNTSHYLLQKYHDLKAEKFLFSFVGSWSN